MIEKLSFNATEQWIALGCAGEGPHYHLCPCGNTIECAAIVECDIEDATFRCRDCRLSQMMTMNDTVAAAKRRKREEKRQKGLEWQRANRMA